MKKLHYLAILVILLSLTMGINCGKKSQIVAEVEGDKITLDEFNLRFEYYLKSKYYQQPEIIPQARNSMEERKLVLRDMINEKIILKEAQKLKLDKRDDVKNLIKLYTQQIVLNAYIEQYLANDINVTDVEITDFYNKNRDKFRNVDPEYAKRSIRYQLMMQKYDVKITEVLDKLKNLYRINENEAAIRPLYSDTNAMPSVPQQGLPRMPSTPMNKTMPATK